MVTERGDVPRLGVRSTRQRAAVIEILHELDMFVSAKDLYHETQRRGYKVGLTTVYRTLQALADMGAVDVLKMKGGESLYRQCLNQGHHHHLVCTQCGRTQEIDGGPVEQWARDIAERFDYELTGHDAEIFGLCRVCKEKEANSFEDLNLEARTDH